MDREFLNQLYINNKLDIKTSNDILNLIEKLQEMLTIKNPNSNISKVLNDMLKEYFCINDNSSLELLDLITEAVSTIEYPTLQDLENKVNEIREGE